MSEGGSAGDAAAFVAKWRGAWPEWTLVQGFVPASEREVGAAWQALQFELQEAAWGGADARPGEFKLAWWGEELAGWAQGRRRHPLGAALHRRASRWNALAQALPALAAARRRPTSSDEAWTAVEAVASAVAAVEAELLGSGADPRAVAAAWLHARLARHPGEAVPRDHSDASSWARTLLRQWPRSSGLPTTRRIELGLARARLGRGDASAPCGPFTALWTGWRAARD